MNEIEIKSLGYRLFISIAGWMLFAANCLAQTEALEQKSVAPKLDEYMNAMTKMFVLYEATFVLDERGLATGLIPEGPWGRNEFKRIE